MKAAFFFFFFATFISQGGMLCCSNKHSLSVSKQKQCSKAGVFLTYTTYLLRGGGALIHVIFTLRPKLMEVPPYRFHRSQEQETEHGEPQVGSTMLQQKRDTHHCCLILLAKASLRAKANFGNTGKCDCS